MALHAHPTILIDLMPEQVLESDTGILHASSSGDLTLTVHYWITTRSILPIFARNRLEAGYDVISYTPFSSEPAWTRLHPDQAITNTISVQINKTNPQTITSQASSMSTSSAPTTPTAHGSSSNTVDLTVALIALMQQFLQQNATMLAQLNSCSSLHQPQTQLLSYQFKSQRPPLSKMGWETTNKPPFPGANRNLQGQILLGRCSRLDKNGINDQTAQRSHKLGHAGFASVINIIDVSKRQKISVRWDHNAVIFDYSP